MKLTTHSLLVINTLNIPVCALFWDQNTGSIDTRSLGLDFDIHDPFDGQQDLGGSSDQFSMMLNREKLPPVVSHPNENETTLIPGEIPDYVLKYAPLVHLYTEERYLPYDVDEYVSNFYLQYGNGTNLTSAEDLPLNLSKICQFIDYTQRPDYTQDLYMTSLQDFSTDPDFITGKKNKPQYENGLIKDAPAILIVVDKGNGWVDSFWFYFYSFNLGPFVMGHGPYGNHVGDWEHSLVRFHNGKPITIWMSAHGGGNGYKFEAVEKYGDFDQGKRNRRADTSEHKPIIFSARGTHANYASVGQHAHDLPYSILSDFTDRGPLWDPSMNYLSYTWDGRLLTPSLNKTSLENNVTDPRYKFNSREYELGPWLLFRAHWGDKKLDPKDPRQVWSPWEYKYIDGPMGPLNKNLVRGQVCQRSKWWNFWNGCTVRRYLDMGSGIESEGSNNCIAIANKIENQVLKQIFIWITYGGWFCFLIDSFWA